MKIKTFILSAILPIALTSFTTVVVAEDGAALYAKKTCTACHGKDAKKTLLPIYPKLAGNNETYLLNQMKDIKSGVRSNGQSAAMKGVMGLVSDAEMVAIAKYLAGLK